MQHIFKAKVRRLAQYILSFDITATSYHCNSQHINSVECKVHKYELKWRPSQREKPSHIPPGDGATLYSCSRKSGETWKLLQVSQQSTRHTMSRVISMRFASRLGECHSCTGWGWQIAQLSLSTVARKQNPFAFSPFWRGTIFFHSRPTKNTSIHLIPRVFPLFQNISVVARRMQITDEVVWFEW